jgi:hypothetical protein
VRIALALSALALLGLGMSPAAAADPFDSITGIPVPAGTTGVQMQTGKFQHGAPSVCSPAKAAPAVDPGNFNYVDFVEQSTINEPACVTIAITTSDPACWSNGLFSASYVDFFSPTAIQTGYVGDVGVGPNDPTPVAYSVVVPPGRFLDTTFHTSVAGAGCSSFDVTWTSDRPWNFTHPSILGRPFAGETLTASDGSWPPAPTLTRQWRRCALDGSACADIPGATGTTYVATPDDVGRSLVLRVTATESGMTSTSDSAPTVVGIQLEALSGQSISGAEPTQHGRLLHNLVVSRCRAPKPAPPAVDPSHTRFYDVFTRTNGTDAALCTIVSLDTPTACSTSGGATSAAYLPSFQPGTSASTNYLADAGFNAQPNGRSVSYSFDVPAGTTYDVVVAPFDTGATCPAYDLRIGTTAPVNQSPPSIGGTAMEGQTLTAGDGSWTGSPTFTYQWQRCFGDNSGCGDIPGATDKTFVLTTHHVGDSFRVRVTGTEGAGSASKTSGPRGPIEPAPPPPPVTTPAFAGIALKTATVLVGKDGIVHLRLTCPADAMLACLGADTLRLGKQKLGSARFLIFAGKSAKLKVRLSKKIRKRLVKKRTLKATQLVTSRDGRNLPVTTRAKLTLKRKR